MYDESIANTPIPELEQEILRYWRTARVFERSVNSRPRDNSFTMYDGPPFATGLPHYGHLLAHTIKDVIPRFKTMKGHRVERRFGWDCHGLPVEFEVEKELHTRGRKDIEKLGVAAFNEKCRSIVLKYTSEWQEVEERLGRWVDMDDDYRTMDLSYMESVWQVFKKLYEKGLIYEGKKVVPYSPRIGTPLSNFEAGLNFRELESPAVTVEFPLATDSDTVLLVWTTTPWSIPSNVALAINRRIPYVRVSMPNGKKYILSEASYERYFADQQIESFRIESIEGAKYAPMFHFIGRDVSNETYRIYHSDHVAADEGTGIVHISPAHGEDDFRLGEEFNLPVIDFFDESGDFTAEVPIVEGVGFRDANDTLIDAIAHDHRLFRLEVITHSYPCCWRSDQPLMYRAVSCWYVRVESMRKRLIENNGQVKWYPETIGIRRFHNWLENARDWAISRDRYWGTPLPVWRCDEDGTDIVVGSAAELEELTGQAIPDLHRHHVDQLILSVDGRHYRRIAPVLDCWFESGAMPYAQEHYMFEDHGAALDRFPADFIAEGVDQTRGWFYTLLVLSTALFDKPAYYNVVVNGIILGNDGRKMSKSLRNYPAPQAIFDSYGADALRFYLLRSKATRAGDLRVSEEDIRGVVRDLLLPILNIYKFFVTYANIDGFQGDSDSDALSFSHPLDKWMLVRTELMRSGIERDLETYDLVAACDQIRTYVDDLSLWYVRNSRRRFWAQGMDADKIGAYRCLFHALTTMSRCIAPILPFVSEAIFRGLNYNDSVHLENWPKAIDVSEHEVLFGSMNTIRRIVALGHRLRSELGLRVRQPLSTLYLDEGLSEGVEPLSALLMQELNVKKIRYIPRTSELLERRVLLNFRHLGPRFRDRLVGLQAAVARGEYQIDGSELYVGGECLGAEDFKIEMSTQGLLRAIEENGLWIVLDTELTEELRTEGAVRDLIRYIQAMRKEALFSVSDVVIIDIGDGLFELVSRNEDLIQSETNSRIRYEPLQDSLLTKEVTIQGHFGKVGISRIVD